MQKSIEYIGRKEPRFCNFAIRAHFHDTGALRDAAAEAGQPKVCLIAVLTVWAASMD